MYDHPALFAEHFLLHFAFVTAAIEAKRICQNHTEINDCCVLLSHSGAILAFLLRFLLGPISKHAVIKTLLMQFVINFCSMLSMLKLIHQIAATAATTLARIGGQMS